ncbi:MAG: sugar kinase [Bacteroidota bacterium]
MKMITFGEIMLRLTPSQLGGKLKTAGELTVSYAGSESNVASSLAEFGHDAHFVTKLPGNELGHGAVRSLKSYGVNTSNILYSDGRIGTYFIEAGKSIRPSQIVYDRKDSVFSRIDPGEFAWERILEGASWLFVSGITAVLSEHCANELIKVTTMARKMNVGVAFDMNYRRSLWKSRTHAARIFDQVLPHTDVLLGNAGVLTDVYDMKFSGSKDEEITMDAMQKAHSQFGVAQLAFTIRKHHSASQNSLQAMYFNHSKAFSSQEYNVEIMDRIGTGDAFAAAFIHGLANQWEDQKVINFAGAAFALKHTVLGDQHTSTEAEIMSIADGNTHGHIIR